MSAALFRSPEFYNKRQKKPLLNQLGMNDGNWKSGTPLKQDETIAENDDKNEIECDEINFSYNTVSNFIIRSTEVTVTSKATSSDTDIISDQTDKSFTESISDSPAKINTNMAVRTGVGDNIMMSSFCFRSVLKLFDFSLFRKPVFVVYLIVMGILATPHSLSMIYLAPHAKAIGVEPEGIAHCWSLIVQ